MAKDFTPLVVTQDEVDVKLAEGLASREMEIHQYDVEQQGHELSIAALGNISWNDPDSTGAIGTLKKYRGMDREQAIRAARQDNLSDADIDRVADLAFLDYLHHNRHACRWEKRRCIQHHENFKTLLPEGDRRTKAIAAHLEKKAGEAAVVKAEQLTALKTVADAAKAKP